MWMQESCEPEPSCRRRWYIGKYLIGIGVAAALMALCVGWPIYDAVAQANDYTLTVEECLGNTNASIEPIAEDLTEQGIIAEDLLPTKVTNGMCEDMLKQAADGTPVGRLVAAQNYIQDIKLIEYTIREATGEAAAKGIDAKGPDHHFLADKLLVLPMWTVLGATKEGSTDDGGIGELNVEPAAYLQDVVHTASPTATDGGGGGGGGTASPTATDGGEGGTESSTATDGGGGGTESASASATASPTATDGGEGGTESASASAEGEGGTESSTQKSTATDGGGGGAESA